MWNDVWFTDLTKKKKVIWSSEYISLEQLYPLWSQAKWMQATIFQPPLSDSLQWVQSVALGKTTTLEKPEMIGFFSIMEYF